MNKIDLLIAAASAAVGLFFLHDARKKAPRLSNFLTTVAAAAMAIIILWVTLSFHSQSQNLNRNFLQNALPLVALVSPAAAHPAAAEALWKKSQAAAQSPAHSWKPGVQSRDFSNQLRTQSVSLAELPPPPQHLPPPQLYRSGRGQSQAHPAPVAWREAPPPEARQPEAQAPDYSPAYREFNSSPRFRSHSSSTGFSTSAASAKNIPTRFNAIRRNSHPNSRTSNRANLTQSPFTTPRKNGMPTADYSYLTKNPLKFCDKAKAKPKRYTTEIPPQEESAANFSEREPLGESRTNSAWRNWSDNSRARELKRDWSENRPQVPTTEKAGGDNGI